MRINIARQPSPYHGRPKWRPYPSPITRRPSANSRTPRWASLLGTRYPVLGTGYLLLLLAACAPVAAPIAPPPTPIARNADWTPVVQDFGGVAMVQVPPGCFTMGNEEGRRDERPLTQVCFERPFWIDQTEVTNAQYGSEGAFTGPQRPRGNLTWAEARDHCAARGARLPTEAEWEYAGRGPDNRMYPWGDELIGDNLIFDQNSGNVAFDVGSRPAGASWVGALDLAGNVWEWVSSAYARYPYDAADGRENLDDLTAQRVYRGGVHSYIDFGAGMATRFRAAADSRDWFVGFRCARNAEG